MSERKLAIDSALSFRCFVPFLYNMAPHKEIWSSKVLHKKTMDGIRPYFYAVIGQRQMWHHWRFCSWWSSFYSETPSKVRERIKLLPLNKKTLVTSFMLNVRSFLSTGRKEKSAIKIISVHYIIWRTEEPKINRTSFTESTFYQHCIFILFFFFLSILQPAFVIVFFSVCMCMNTLLLRSFENWVTLLDRDCEKRREAQTETDSKQTDVLGRLRAKLLWQRKAGNQARV